MCKLDLHNPRTLMGCSKSQVKPFVLLLIRHLYQNE